MRAAAIFALLLLAGCEDRRSFDDRYAATANAMEQRAANLDAELNRAPEEPEAPDQ